MKSTFGTILICLLSVIFFNCTKKLGDVKPPLGNYSTFTDQRDGKTYKSITIGTQVWMAENLAYQTVSGSWNYLGDKNLGAKFGRLYTWAAALEAVPAGWHLPTDEEWKKLEMTLGMSQSAADCINNRGTNEGRKLKTTLGWEGNTNGTDEVGFAALPGGFRSNSGTFLADGYYGYWWTSTEDGTTNAWIRLIESSNFGITRNISFKEDAYSVRCVKN